MVLNFNDGSYFYSVLPLIEVWKVKNANQEAIKIGALEIKVLEVKPGKEMGGMCVDTLLKFEINGSKVVVHCYNTKAKMLINGSGIPAFLQNILNLTSRKQLGTILL